jgi:AcrR family transcriptional regulator
MSEMRGTAEQRRIQAVEAGLTAFADHGLTTAAIRQVAEQVGVSQPYVFRLFGSKQSFFLACIDELDARVVRAFGQAAHGVTDEPLEQMGASFRSLVSDGTVSGLWLQACAVARADDVVAQRCRTLISNVLRATEEHSGASTDELAAFLGRGALVVLLQALGVDLREGSRAAVVALRDAGDAP